MNSDAERNAVRESLRAMFDNPEFKAAAVRAAYARVSTATCIWCGVACAAISEPPSCAACVNAHPRVQPCIIEVAGK